MKRTILSVVVASVGGTSVVMHTVSLEPVVFARLVLPQKALATP